MAEPTPERQDLRERIGAVLSSLGETPPGAVESVIAAVSPVLERQRIANRALKTAVVEALERAEQAEAERDEARRELAGLRSAVKTVGQALDSLDCPHEAQVAALREELAGMRDLFEAANQVAGTRTDERDEARRMIDDTLWRMHQLRSWAYRDTSGDVQHNVLSVITNVWDCLDPDRTRGPVADARPDDPEEIRRLAQATTEETNDG